MRDIHAEITTAIIEGLEQLLKFIAIGICFCTVVPRLCLLRASITKEIG